MQYRTLGSSGMKFSVIGLGTWAIGGGDWKFGWGDQDEQEAIDTIVRAVESGINWIDTAAIYGEGRSEILVAKAMQKIPAADRPFIATKCGRVAIGNGEIGKSLRRDSVIAECEASLKRLQTDCIDLYQLHWPEPDEEVDRALGPTRARAAPHLCPWAAAGSSSRVSSGSAIGRGRPATGRRCAHASRRYRARERRVARPGCSG